MMLRCLLVDDEPLALQVLQEYVEMVPFLTLAGTCNNAFDALNMIGQQPIDLVFLDIEMPGLSGVQLAKALPRPIPIVFTTAYSQYAIEGFDVSAVDYLLKPIPYERFLKAVTKAKSWIEGKHATIEPEQEQTSPLGQERDYLFVRSEYKLVQVKLSTIRYLEGCRDYVKINYGQRPLLTLDSLQSLTERLPSKHFVRIHRSFVVNLAMVSSVNKTRVVIEEKELPVGETYAEKLMQLVL